MPRHFPLHLPKQSCPEEVEAEALEYHELEGSMLHEFISTHREEILGRTRKRVAERSAPQPTHAELDHGVPLFLDEIVAILASGRVHSREMTRDAAIHGEHRQRAGFTIAQVVRDYGDICQVVTELALELGADIDSGEFRVLNGCLDDAIAEAVTHYSRQRERSISDDEVQRLGFLAHELRNHLHTASLSFNILKGGTVAIGGSTGAVLGHSLAALGSLVDRTLAEVRLDSGIYHSEPIEIAPFLEEVEAAGSILAKDSGISLSIERGDAGIAVQGDRQLLGSALANLLQNAFKFTSAAGHVELRATATEDRVVIEVEDECGGVLRLEPSAEPSKTGPPVVQKTSGLGMGLSISRRAIETMGGTVRARNRDRLGCVFTIDLPRLVTQRR